MPTKTVPTYLPYRDAHSTQVKYTLDPNTLHATSMFLPYNSDSDAEPLLPLPSSTPIPPSLTEHDLQHFTATGRPAPVYKPSSLSSMGGHMLTAPQLLPQRYTDDSIIPAIIVNVIPSPELHPPKKQRRGSLGLLGKIIDRKGKEDGEGEVKGITKVAFMPRRDYLKWFARGFQGEYIGSEPYRRWSEEELEREFGRYKPGFLEKKGRKGSRGSRG